MAVDYNPGPPFFEGPIILLNSAVVSAVPLSLFCWFNFSGASATCLIAINRTPAQGFADFEHFSLEIEQSPTCRVFANQVGPAAGNGFAEVSAYTTNIWQSAGAVFASNSSRTAYVNGVPGTTDTAVANAPTVGGTQIGARLISAGDTFRGMSGCMAHAAIWNVALSDGQMAALAAGTPPSSIASANLVAYLPLATAATAGDNTVGSDFTVSTLSGTVTDCASSPNVASAPMVIGPYTRIIGF